MLQDKATAIDLPAPTPADAWQASSAGMAPITTTSRSGGDAALALRSAGYDIELRDVVFRYRPEDPPILDGEAGRAMPVGE